MKEKITNAEYMINLLMDFLDENGIEFHRFSIDDGGASEEAMIYCNVDCPYYASDSRCECNDIGPGETPSRKMCSECKYKWLASEADE